MLMDEMSDGLMDKTTLRQSAFLPGWLQKVTLFNTAKAVIGHIDRIYVSPFHLYF